MLLHLEIQGNSEKDFSRRMFEYFIRVFSKHGRPVAAIAVLTGKSSANMRAAYEDRCLWMRARYEYKTLSIGDYPDEALKASTNPFAAVVLVAKEVLLRVKGTDEKRDKVLLEHKIMMVRLLKEKMAVFGEKKTEAILGFLNNYVVFKKPETNRKFMEQTDEIFEKKNTMGIIEQLAQIKHREGIEEGREIGLEKGREIGLEEGREKGRKEQKEELVRSLLANTEFSPEKIAELVDVPVSLVKKIKTELSAK